MICTVSLGVLEPPLIICFSCAATSTNNDAITVLSVAVESTPRRNIATCIREKSFLSFFYDRLLPSHEWWRRRKLTSSKTRRPVSATDYVTNSAVLSTTATSQDSVTDSDEDDMTVDEELSNFLRKYSYVRFVRFSSCDLSEMGVEK